MLEVVNMTSSTYVVVCCSSITEFHYTHQCNRRGHVEVMKLLLALSGIDYIHTNDRVRTMYKCWIENNKCIQTPCLVLFVHIV
jgi:hypothetical protein